MEIVTSSLNLAILMSEKRLGMLLLKIG